MNFRLTGVLALAAVGLGLLIVFWDQDDDNVRARVDRARQAFRFDPARVDRLIIETGDPSIECQLQGRQWHLTRPLSARADPVAIERLLGALQELPRGDILLPPRREGDPYAPYGLDAPRACISIIEGAVTNRILIGRRTPLGDGVYVRQSEHSGLARINTSLLDLLPASAAALRDRSLLAGAPAAIERLDIRSPAGYIQLAREENNGWRMFQPFAARADSAIVAALVEKLLSCSVVQFIQDAASDLSPYGLDSQSAVTAVLNTDSGDGSQMLALGDPLPNDPALVYARLQAENSVYAVPLEIRQALLVPPEDLRDRRIPGLDPGSIQRVRIEEAEHTLEFFRDDDGGWQLSAPLRVPADAEAIRSLLQSWTDVRLTAFENPSASNPPPVWTRTIQITPRGDKAPPVVLRLAPNPVNPSAACIAIDGDSSIAVASSPLLLEFPLDPVPYRSRDVFSIPADDIAAIHIASGAKTVEAIHDPATGQWIPDAPWIEGLLAHLSPLRAESILPSDSQAADRGFAEPHLTVTLQLRGQSGLATTLLVGPEVSPGGPRRATVRGRDFAFTLSPWTVEALAPPSPAVTE